MAKYPASTMSEVAYWNRFIGHHWFDEDTMEFWGCKIESSLYKNSTFITSDYNFDRTQRLYTVRYYDPETAHIEDASEFQQFKTREDAKRFALSYEEGTQ